MEFPQPSDPFKEIPATVRERIWSYFSQTDLKNVQLVSTSWFQWSRPRYLIWLNPTTQSPNQLSNYVANYPNYGRGHQRFEISTIGFHNASTLQEFIDISMSMNLITILFEEYAKDVKGLVIRHRSSPISDEFNRLKKADVEQFIQNILSHCPDLEELGLDLDLLEDSWFPEERVFLNLKTLRIDSFLQTRNNPSNVRTSKTDFFAMVTAGRIASATPNLERFITEALWSDVHLMLMSNMAYNSEDNDRCWPRLQSIEVRKTANIQTFVFSLRALDRPMKVLHFGTISQWGFVSGIMDVFKNTLEEVEMSVEMKNGFSWFSGRKFPKMPRLQRLSFVGCTIDVRDSSSKSTTTTTTTATNSGTPTTARGGTRKRKRQGNKDTTTTIQPRTVVDQVDSTTEYTNYYMMKFCNVLSEMFTARSKLEETLPNLHTFKLMFKSGFQELFYNIYFPALVNYQVGVEGESFPQIRTLAINYPRTPWDSEGIARVLSLSKLFPNVHNHQFNYARKCTTGTTYD